MDSPAVCCLQGSSEDTGALRLRGALSVQPFVEVFCTLELQ